MEVETLLSLASTTIELDRGVAMRALELTLAGYGRYDALHLASAEAAGDVVILTTDDRMIKRAARRVGNPGIPVRNPVSWSKECGS